MRLGSFSLVLLFFFFFKSLPRTRNVRERLALFLHGLSMFSHLFCLSIFLMLSLPFFVFVFNRLEYIDLFYSASGFRVIAKPSALPSLQRPSVA